MEWIDRLQGTVVGLDTAPLIYFMEENERYTGITQPFFETVHEGGIQVVTSVVTLLEVLVQPLRAEDHILADQYRDILLNSERLTTIMLTPDIGEEAARLRATHSIRTPDAIQIATALHAGAQFFLTNDHRLTSIREIEVLLLDDLLAP